MPGGKYYCDYCDKEFRDTPSARKRHLLGVQHQRNRSLWYSSLPKDPNLISNVPKGFGKGVCNRFIRTGFCPYGDSCKYLHPKPQFQDFSAPGTPCFGDNPQLQTGGGFLQGDAAQNLSRLYGNLPPSLQPPPEGGYPPLPFVDWG